MTDKLVVFKGKDIRRTLHNNEWWFSVVDIVGVLTESADPKQYIKRMRSRDNELSGNWGTICTLLELTAKDGKNRKENCANTEGVFRIVQSIPSPKAEPFKRWLAKVGYERIQEIEDPELAQKRTRVLYKSKGYPDEWIEKRMRGIAIREELTGEWGDRGIEEQKDFAILTAEIHEATFGMKPSEHKSLKDLKRENLCDHMTDLELIFSMLGEASTTEITRNKEAQGFNELEKAAKSGGEIAGDARRKLEIESGKDVVTPQNYLSNKKDNNALTND
jgi:DNA-damage-inducible protein D